MDGIAKVMHLKGSYGTGLHPEFLESKETGLFRARMKEIEAEERRAGLVRDKAAKEDHDGEA